MKKWYQSVSYYYKYLVSYVVILIIPILFIALYVDISIVKTLEEEVYINDVNSLHQVKTSIEYYLEHMEKIKNEVYLETYRNPFYFEEDPIRGIETIDTLKQYELTNPFIESAFMYYCGDEYIYRGAGTCPIDIFVERIYKYENLSNEEFSYILNNSRLPAFRPAEKVNVADGYSKEVVTMLYPLNVNFADPYGMLIFIIPKEIFEARISDRLGDDEKLTFILNQDNEIMVSSTYDDEFNQSEFMSNILSSNAEDLIEMRVSNKTYLTTIIESEKSGWKYVSLTPQQRIGGKVKDVRFGFFMGIGLIMFMGLLAIAVSMYINYNPIRRLKLYSEDLLGNDHKSSSELELVRETIDYLHDQNELLSEEVEGSSVANRQYITMQMLKGGKMFDKVFYQKAMKYGVVLKDRYTVAIFYVNTKEEFATSKKDILNQVNKHFDLRGNVYACENFDFRKIITIITYDECEELEIYNELKYLQTNLKAEYEIKTTIGVSREFNEYDMIPKAYIEATTSLDYRLIKGNGCLLKYQDVVTNVDLYSDYPSEHMTNINKMLRSGNIESIESELDLIVDYVKDSNSPIFVARGICFDLIKMIIQTSHDLVHEFKNNPLEIPDVFMLTTYETIDELIIIIKDVSHNLCTRIIEQKDKEELSLIHEMVVYIQNNYTDINFSLLGMADYFNMSQSRLSMYFKEKTGQKVLNYITKMKLDKAKELLTTTTIPLNKLSLAVGYTNVTSFIRRFKQWEEITPGEYRKKFS